MSPHVPTQVQVPETPRGTLSVRACFAGRVNAPAWHLGGQGFEHTCKQHLGSFSTASPLSGVRDLSVVWVRPPRPARGQVIALHHPPLGDNQPGILTFPVRPTGTGSLSAVLVAVAVVTIARAPGSLRRSGQ